LEREKLKSREGLFLKNAQKGLSRAPQSILKLLGIGEYGFRKREP
jgi:hypothetical protein